jgi:fatty acid-binding protein DegV
VGGPAASRRWRPLSGAATRSRCGSHSTRSSTCAAQAWLGSALQIKPILTLGEEITPVERVRTRRRAFERLVEFARSRQVVGADAWVVQHIQDHETARHLVEECRDIFGSEPAFVSEVGPVLGAHAGPGMIGVGGVASSLLGSSG